MNTEWLCTVNYTLSDDLAAIVPVTIQAPEKSTKQQLEEQAFEAADQELEKTHPQLAQNPQLSQVLGEAEISEQVAEE